MLFYELTPPLAPSTLQFFSKNQIYSQNEVLLEKNLQNIGLYHTFNKHFSAVF